MARCDLCGNEAGWLIRQHDACREALQPMVDLIAEAAAPATPPEDLKQQIDEVAIRYAVAPDCLSGLLATTWDTVADDTLQGQLISEEQEAALLKLRDDLGLPGDRSEWNGARGRVRRTGIIRELLQGTLPEQMGSPADLPFDLLPSEAFIWKFDDVDYYERPSAVRYRDGRATADEVPSAGILSREELRERRAPVIDYLPTDQGIAVMTDRQLYFAGSKQIFRIPFMAVADFTPFNDGLALQCDGQAATLYFLTDDGWFIYHLAVGLAARQSATESTDAASALTQGLSRRVRAPLVVTPR
ncbi:MAG: hypothetical protein ACOX8V_05575 [Thermoleophilia bacterium]|jgi:hypothetical protein